MQLSLSKLQKVPIYKYKDGMEKEKKIMQMVQKQINQTK